MIRTERPALQYCQRASEKPEDHSGSVSGRERWMADELMDIRDAYELAHLFPPSAELFSHR